MTDLIIDAQTIVEALKVLVIQERLAQQEESASLDYLSLKAQVALGYALDGLVLVSQRSGELGFQISENNSRFRPGDTLIIRCQKVKFDGTLLSIEPKAGGIVQLVFRVSKIPAELPKGPWTVLGTDADHLAVVMKALEKLQPGAPGWGLAKRLSGETDTQLKELTGPQLREVEELYQSMISAIPLERHLDPSQLNVFMRCLATPAVLGVQGPPGTGKTFVLAYVIEALARRGKRVVLVAPTHQAVNNALSAIHALFPARRLIKYGDEFKSEGLSPDIPIISSIQALPVETHETIVGLSYQAAIQRLMISDHKALSPHVLVIDEAGQLPLSQGICAGLCGAGSILLFGDDQQMPPVFSSDVSENSYALSIFAQLRKVVPDAIRMLEITYRLNSELCRSIAKAFYDSSGNISLRPSIQAGSRTFRAAFSADSSDPFQNSVLRSDHSLVWVCVPETIGLQHNPKEALIAAQLISFCLHHGLDASEVAVVTPFRRQAMLIRNLLGSALEKDALLPIIDTVERVQGATVEMVVVSLCASQPDYVASLAGFLFSPNRMNVAISRARTKAIILASPDIFNVTPLEYQGLQFRNKCEKLFEQGHHLYCP